MNRKRKNVDMAIAEKALNQSGTIAFPGAYKPQIAQNEHSNEISEIPNRNWHIWMLEILHNLNWYIMPERPKGWFNTAWIAQMIVICGSLLTGGYFLYNYVHTISVQEGRRIEKDLQDENWRKEVNSQMLYKDRQREMECEGDPSKPGCVAPTPNKRK